MANKNKYKRRISNRKNAILTEHKLKTPPTLIHTWEELVGLESPTHCIVVDLGGGCGYVKPKVTHNYSYNQRNWFKRAIYLSTHTFYGSQYRSMTTLLRKLGFNIQLYNWDGDTIYSTKRVKGV